MNHGTEVPVHRGHNGTNMDVTTRFSMNSHANCSLALKFKVEKISYTRRKWHGCS